MDSRSAEFDIHTGVRDPVELGLLTAPGGVAGTDPVTIDDEVVDGDDEVAERTEPGQQTTEGLDAVHGLAASVVGDDIGGEDLAQRLDIAVVDRLDAATDKLFVGHVRFSWFS